MKLNLASLLKTLIRAAKPIVIAAVTTAATDALAKRLGKRR